jgi:hypothetical protein
MYVITKAARNTACIVKYLPLTLSLFISLVSCHAATVVVKPYDCNDYPPPVFNDSSLDISASITGARRFVGAEVKGKLQLQAKKYLADHPDANKITVVLALIAYNCRAIQAAGMPEDEKFKARKDLNTLILQSISDIKSESSPVERKERPSKERLDNFPKKSGRKEQSAIPLASLVIAAKDLSNAAHRYKSAVSTMYLAALGGAYVPVLPYDLMLHKDMLNMASKQNLMRGVPNVTVIPEEAETSLANDICRSIDEADGVVQKVFSLYNAKIPEYLYQDILNITDTKLYQYFKTYVSENECEVFQGELKNEWDKKAGRADEPKRLVGYPIPVRKPVVTPLELEQYVISVRKFDTDVAKILDANYKKT